MAEGSPWSVAVRTHARPAKNPPQGRELRNTRALDAGRAQLRSCKSPRGPCVSTVRHFRMPCRSSATLDHSSPRAWQPIRLRPFSKVRNWGSGRMRAGEPKPMIRFASPRGARGVSMIEVLVAIVIFSLGLLGLAMMQLKGASFTKDSGARSVAVLQARSLADRMQANPTALAEYATATSTGGIPGYTDCSPNCTSTQVA